nr:Chain B, Protein FimF [Escherichia coli K-12]5IQM_F Chain F, Protein FimF [Escherichia coli K-12]5IQO_B Chain B, Protein FimF [Escherichia coli K-12]5IQO_D Chain D, Protein FimF [Escherichia coli K-12]
ADSRIRIRGYVRNNG